MDDPIDSTNEHSLQPVFDSIGDLVTGIPAPIRKNALRAFTRLCTALVEYPLVFLENAVTEKRAESQARVKLINVSAEQIASQMHTDPEYARAAATKFAHRIIRERLNIDRIAQIAAEELKSEGSAASDDHAQGLPPIEIADETAPISEDWLNTFEDQAAHMSSEEMQCLFARILAGEIRKPASYSIKTVKLIAQLDNTAAAIFKTVCSLCISYSVPGLNAPLDARAISLGGSAGENSLADYGLGFQQLSTLTEYGLITSDFHTWADYQLSIARGKAALLPISYQNELWALVPHKEMPQSTNLKMYGVALTGSGRELLSIVDKQPNGKYTAALLAFIDKLGMQMTKVDSLKPD
jgi:hypothetical protein